MACLQMIPRELRDEILHHVLVARRTAPKTSADIEKQYRESLPGPNSLSGSPVFYSSDPADFTPTALPLLLTCKQLHDETKENLFRIFPGGPDYDLDIKFVNDRYLAPTWTSVPVLSHRVNKVRAAFQSTGIGEHPVSGRSLRDIWRGGSGGPPGFVWMFYSLLDRFLHIGPRAKQKDESETERLITIDCLELDFIDPEPSVVSAHELVPIGMKIRHSYMRPRTAAQTDKPQLVSAESLASTICSEIRALLHLGYHTADYGAVFYQCIGSVILKLNGKTIDELDLGQLLVDLRFQDSFGNTVVWDRRLEYWIDWKKTVLEARKERQLRVIDPGPDWILEAERDAERIYAGRVI